MQDTCQGPYSVDSRKLLWLGRTAIRRSLPGLSRPYPRLHRHHRHHRHPLPARQAPRPRGEKRSVLSCILFPLRKFVFRHLFAGKRSRPADKGDTQKTDPVEPCVHAIPSCCDGGVSLMRRDRPFRGRLPGGPDIGLPAVPASLSERVPVVPQIPLRRNSSTDEAEMFLKDGNRPISLALFSPTIRQRKGKGRRARRKKRTRDSKTPDRESSLFDTCVQGQ